MKIKVVWSEKDIDVCKFIYEGVALWTIIYLLLLISLNIIIIITIA